MPTEPQTKPVDVISPNFISWFNKQNSGSEYESAVERVIRPHLPKGEPSEPAAEPHQAAGEGGPLKASSHTATVGLKTGTPAARPPLPAWRILSAKIPII